MKDKPIYCPKCKDRIPGGIGMCPTCGGPPVYLLHGIKPQEAANNPWAQNAIIAALVVILAVILARVVYPNLPVKVERTEITACAGSNQEISRLVYTDVITRKRLDGYQNESTRYVECDSPGVSKSTATAKVVVNSGQSDNPGDPTGWSDELPEIRKGMSHSQVMSAWGEPIAIERIVTGDNRVERWLYGDPLYGIKITDRYVDFTGDGVARAFYSNGLSRLHKKVIEERRSGRY